MCAGCIASLAISYAITYTSRGEARFHSPGSVTPRTREAPLNRSLGWLSWQPAEEHVKGLQLRKWISELDWERRDSQIEADSEAGQLDFLIAEAREARERGALEEL